MTDSKVELANRLKRKIGQLLDSYRELKRLNESLKMKVWRPSSKMQGMSTPVWMRLSMPTDCLSRLLQMVRIRIMQKNVLAKLCGK